MATIIEKPEGRFCYEPHMFKDSEECPDYDSEVALEPKCKKYGKDLSWTMSGRVLKCDECLGNK